MSKRIIQLNESAIKDEIKELVHSSVEETQMICWRRKHKN